MSVQALSWVFDHEKTTSGTDRLVLLALANHANDAGEAWPSKATLARETNITREETVRLSLRRLELAGLIETVTKAAPDERIPADRRPNLYRLLFSVDNSTTPRLTGPRQTRERLHAKRANDSTRNGGETVIEPSMNQARPKPPSVDELRASKTAEFGPVVASEAGRRAGLAAVRGVLEGDDR